MKKFWVFVLTGMLLIVTTTGFARMAYGIILPFMQEGLSLTTSQSGYLGTMLFLGYLLTVGLSGVLTIRIGAKNVLLVGGVCVVLGLMGLVFVTSFWEAAITLFFAGAGSALVYTPLLSIAISLYPKKRGAVMGLLMSGAGIGMLLSGLLVPFMLQQFPTLGWRGAWLVFAILTLIVMLLAFWTIKQPNPVKKDTIQEKTTAWRNKQLYIIAGIYFAVGLVYLIPNLYQTSYMKSLGLSNGLAGSIYAIAGIVSIGGAPFWGMLADKMGVKKALTAALLLSVVGDLLPIVFENIGGFILSSIIWGSSLGGVLVLIQMKASQQVPPPYIASAIGFISIFYAVGQMMGPGLAGWLIEHVGGFPVAYGFGAIVFFICILLAFTMTTATTEEF
ncbi:MULTISPECIES: MFS transporter [Lysinibacillus]|uniref:MFS transporter n=1 Tax=Lysinibacillus TaxID=400634 RepID=UPI0005600AC7|nr:MULTISPECIES: MFS transporter [Lysinibacillus]SCY91735.1 Sugar phosphate permease [Lysinibacillus sp. SG9]SDB42579.1 Sugar phosphate permease [Lysinibacillus sp. TC-37]SFT06060.1 Sugar phosphate permease [Lysinibacillus sp. SG55]